MKPSRHIGNFMALVRPQPTHLAWIDVMRITLAVPHAAKPLRLTDTLSRIAAAVESDRISLGLVQYLLPVNGAVRILHLQSPL
jgi:hypothetical protein